MDNTIAIVGTGNLAFHLAAVLSAPVVTVSREAEKQVGWASPVVGYDELSSYHPNAVLLAVPDQVIAETSARLSQRLPPDIPVFHTSGATPVGAINEYFHHRGVLWPIRSLRKGEAVTDWKDLPLAIYATDTSSTKFIRQLAESLSDTVTWLDDRQRAQLHLAAVFSNNFVTALYEVSFQLCEDHGVPFELLLPIIRNTAASQTATAPAYRQTGAAVRNDQVTMDRHRSLIANPIYRDLYSRMSALIVEQRATEHNADFRGNTHHDLEDEGVP